MSPPRRRDRPVTRAALAAAALALVAACERTPQPAASPAPQPAPPPAPDGAAGDGPRLPPEAEFLRQVDRSRGTKDCFLPLRDPPFDPADAATGLSDDERVIGLDLGDTQCAYPVQLLDHHEIVEHRLAGLELLACW